MAKNLEDMMSPHEGGLSVAAPVVAGMSVAGAPPAAIMLGGLTAYGVGRAGQHLRRFTKGGPSVAETVAEGKKRHPALNDKQKWNGR
jgi:hypothetical protein